MKNRLGALGWGYILRLLLPLGALAALLVLTGAFLGLAKSTAPNEHARVVRLLIEQAQGLLAQDDLKGLGKLLHQTLADSPDIKGYYLLRADKTLFSVGGEIDFEHRQQGTDPDAGPHVLMRAGQPWGELSFSFQTSPTLDSGSARSLPIGLAAFVGVMVILLAGLLPAVRRALRFSGLSVESIFQGLVEGVVLLDRDAQIVKANSAFARALGLLLEDLRGRRLSEFHWQALGRAAAKREMPWDLVLSTQAAELDNTIVLITPQRGRRVFAVNVTPLLEDGRGFHGVLATFSDQTAGFEKTATLRQALATLQQQRREIDQQNEELKSLATRDSLTSCLNRRAFLAIFEAELLAARKRGYPLSCIMSDIDAFKAINDTYGHSAGDQVIVHVARLIQATVRDNDHLCRYGGEEFCILLPGMAAPEAALIAERMRAAIESRAADLATVADGQTITASFGVTDLALAANSLSELIDQADAALYVSKQSGRNRVSVFGRESVEKPFSQRPVHPI